MCIRKFSVIDIFKSFVVAVSEWFDGLGLMLERYMISEILSTDEIQKWFNVVALLVLRKA